MSEPPTGSGPSPDPALRVEYTDRLLVEYTRLKEANKGCVTLAVVADAIQYSAKLLQTLEDCAEWTSRKRFDTYKDVFAAMHLDDTKEDHAEHGMTFAEFQSIFPGPKQSSEMQVDPLPQKHKTPTPDPGGDADELEAATANQRLGKLAALPRKELPKHSLRDRIRHAHISGILHLARCGLKYFPGDGDLLHYMREIKVLSLNHNQLTTLPSELAYLPKIEHLTLSSNLLEELPNSIAGMANLKALDVSNNRIKYLPPELGNLRAIQTVCANRNQIRSLPYSIGNLKTLHRLDLKGNPLFPALLDKYNEGLPVLLSFLEAIQTAIHEATLAGDKPFGELKTEESVFENELLLSRGEFGMVGTIVDTRRKIIDYRIKHAQDTRTLTLEHINLRDLSDEMIVPEAVSLRFSHNRRLDVMPDNVSKFLCLVRLEANGCGIRTIPESCGLGNLSTLESINLSDNCLEALPGHAVKNLKRLKVIDVSKNKLVKFPVELASLLSLKTFLFHENPIPNLAGLRQLVKDSGIPGLQSEIIARAKGYVSTVDTKDIEEGALADRFDVANKTNVLELGSCGLTIVPDKMLASAYYGKITDIVLARNQLQSIPSKLENMYRLRRLDMSRNLFNNASFPPDLMNLKSLVQLNVSHNRLKTFPVFILEFRLLRLLNVSNNQMKSVPTDLRHLSKLEHLAIENNPLPARFLEEAAKGILDFMQLLEDVVIEEEQKKPVYTLATGDGEKVPSPRLSMAYEKEDAQGADGADEGEVLPQIAVADEPPKYVFNKARKK